MTGLFVGVAIFAVLIASVYFSDRWVPVVWPEDSGKTAQTGISSLIGSEKRTLELVNVERAAAGLRQLTWNDNLAQVAKDHSALMARTGNFEHSGNQYYNCMGENLFMSTGWLSPEDAVNGWMDSPGHRDAILFESHFAGGVGIVTANNGSTYYTLIMDSTLC